MQKKISLILCLSLMLTMLSGCSIIDILVQSVTTKTSILLEVAKVYSDYVIAYPVGRVMRSIEPSEPIIIPHKQEAAYPMEFGFVPDVLVYPENPAEPLSGYIYSIESNYLDVSAIRNFDDTALQVGDQLTVAFDEGDMNLANNTIIAKSINVKFVNDMDFNELESDDLILGDPYKYNVDCNDMSVYSLISILMEYGTVHCTEGNNELWLFKGYETSITVFFENRTHAGISIYQYPSNAEMMIDAYNMNKDGEYNGKAYPLQEYYFKIGKIILEVRDSNEASDYDAGKLLEILKTHIGDPYARTFPKDNFIENE
ncbi:MAG TPA: hypothetical protein DCM01_11970 [Dielma fastidiosa]|nr:hypothetical protein [Dielma fastidiosa]